MLPCYSCRDTGVLQPCSLGFSSGSGLWPRRFESCSVRVLPLLAPPESLGKIFSVAPPSTTLDLFDPWLGCRESDRQSWSTMRRVSSHLISPFFSLSPRFIVQRRTAATSQQLSQLHPGEIPTTISDKRRRKERVFAEGAARPRAVSSGGKSIVGRPPSKLFHPDDASKFFQKTI